MHAGGYVLDQRITTPFGFQSTALEVVEGIDLSGMRAIVTGGSSGIGIETARALAQAGAEVTLAVRSVETGGRVAAEIISGTGNSKVSVSKLDLSDWGLIDQFVSTWDGPLHLLVNNAGIMALPERELSPQGHELQFATNHLGHFRLTLGLHMALKSAGAARIVSVSSRGHLRSSVIFEDIDFNSRPYDPWLGYGQSKTANILFAVGATQRWGGDGITANAIHPGVILDTNLSRHMAPGVLTSLLATRTFHAKTLEQGAATSVLVGTSPQLKGIGGRYFEDCNEAVVLNEGDLNQYESGVAAYAVDPAMAAQLWDVSEHMLASSPK